MPYKLVEADGGWYVENSETGKRHSQKPLSKAQAGLQMRALYAAENALAKKEFVSDEQRKAVFANVGVGSGISGIRNLAKRSGITGKIWKDRDGNINISGRDRNGKPARIKSRTVTGMREFLIELRQRIKKQDMEDEQRRKAEIEKIEAARAARKESAPGALTVFKDASGVYRWVLLSSNAYQDRDKEIVSTKALEADVARADQDGEYGPLRWWHVGTPDLVRRKAGQGADIGTCDFNAMHGRVLVESGTFKSEKIAEAIAPVANQLQASIGFLHPAGEPDRQGVYHSIHRFERSLLPRGRASNPFTSLIISQKGDHMVKEKIAALKALLGGDDELVKMVLGQAESAEKAAQEQGAAFKERAEEVPEEDPVEAEAVEEVLEEDDKEASIGSLSAEAFAGLMAEVVNKATEPFTQEVKSLKATMALKDDAQAALKEALEAQGKKGMWPWRLRWGCW